MESSVQEHKEKSSSYQAGCGVAEWRSFQLPGAGLQCGHCGEFLPRVFRTITSRGFITRERICPKCGKINTTSERVLNTRNRKGSFNDPCENT